MEYIKRALENKFLKMNKFFKVMLLTGARQVGKTTMLKHLAADQSRTYISMDNALARELAKNDPELFFQRYKPPIIIDEIQKAPELLEQIKLLCDESEEKGQFWLTGSQKYNAMKNVRESLAGRVGILELYSLTKHETDNLIFDDTQDFSLATLLARQAKSLPVNIVDVFQYIWQGGMPYILQADNDERNEYFNSYIETYLMRDAAELGGITDAFKFRRFLVACAALAAEQVNYKTLADAVDISQPTAKLWLQLLQAMDIVYLLQPFANNELKRLAKTPKLYFCDTGLAAYLSMWPTADTLMTGAANGHYFENFVVMELVKTFAYQSSKVNLSYYRDSNAKEIDIIVEKDGYLHPLEVKKSANPDTREVKKFTLLDKASLPRANGGIVCMSNEILPIDNLNCFIPCNLL